MKMQVPKHLQNIQTLTALIAEMKSFRNFNAEDYLDKKRAAINKFFRDNHLDSAVVGLSGGVDSAVTMMLLLSASDMYGSPIKKIVAVIAPIPNEGSTGQMEAANKALRLTEKFNFVGVLETAYCNLKASADGMMNAVKTVEYDKQVGDIDNTSLRGYEKTPWMVGQMNSILRTPLFYFQAAKLQAEGFRSLVVGTTNRDEGSYIGFFGKASDAMVDLQPIADIHKSEVYQVAKILGVTEEILEATPQGDVWDSRIDEEMIGANYPFLEMYLNLMMQSTFQIETILKNMENTSGEDYYYFKKSADAIEKLHNTNKHKYQVGSPAHFIDVLPRTVPGGWK